MTTAKKKAMAIRHVHFEDLGSFATPIENAGFEIVYLEAGRDDLRAASEADLTVFLGGPIGILDKRAYPFLMQELSIAAKRLERQQPILGICLGSQIIAHAAGAKVYAGAGGKEIGWKPLSLTKEGRDSVVAPLGEDGGQMLHWHGDTFDLPAGAQLLASTADYPNQIYAIGEHVLAFQCHPELNPHAFEHWLVGHAFEIAKTPGVNPVGLREDTAKFANALQRRGRRTIENWLSRFQK